MCLPPGKCYLLLPNPVSDPLTLNVWQLVREWSRHTHTHTNIRGSGRNRNACASLAAKIVEPLLLQLQPTDSREEGTGHDAAWSGAGGGSVASVSCPASLIAWTLVVPIAPIAQVECSVEGESWSMDGGPRKRNSRGLPWHLAAQGCHHWRPLPYLSCFAPSQALWPQISLAKQKWVEKVKVASKRDVQHHSRLYCLYFPVVQEWMITMSNTVTTWNSTLG